MRKIGDIADELGVSSRTLRYWEALGLLPPAERSRGRFRLYDERHVRIARGIAELKAMGFPLDDIRAMQREFASCETSLDGMTGITRSLAQTRDVLRARIREDLARLAGLRRLERCVQACDGCDGKSFDSECTSCLSEAVGRPLPEALEGVFSAHRASKLVARASVPLPNDDEAS